MGVGAAVVVGVGVCRTDLGRLGDADHEVTGTAVGWDDEKRHGFLLKENGLGVQKHSRDPTHNNELYGGITEAG